MERTIDNSTTIEHVIDYMKERSSTPSRATGGAVVILAKMQKNGAQLPEGVAEFLPEWRKFESLGGTTLEMSKAKYDKLLSLLQKPQGVGAAPPPGGRRRRGKKTAKKLYRRRRYTRRR